MVGDGPAIVKKATSAKDRGSKKQDASAQTRIGNSKITKPSVSRPAKKKATETGGDAKSVPQQQLEPVVVVVDDDPQEEDVLGLKKALARKRNWTPTKEVHRKEATPETPASLHIEHDIPQSTCEPQQEHHRGSFLDQYGFEPSLEQPAIVANATATNGSSILKKRKIEASH